MTSSLWNKKTNLVTFEIFQKLEFPISSVWISSGLSDSNAELSQGRRCLLTQQYLLRFYQMLVISILDRIHWQKKCLVLLSGCQLEFQVEIFNIKTYKLKFLPWNESFKLFELQDKNLAAKSSRFWRIGSLARDLRAAFLNEII